MILNYKAFTNEDISRMKSLPKGDYDFYISSVETQPSKGGTDKNGQPKKIYNMLVITLRILYLTSERQIKDWVLLVESDDTMGFKLRHLADTCGLLGKYESNTLEDSDFINKHGKAKIGVREYQDQYGEIQFQNTVIDYIKSSADQNSSNNRQSFYNDDVPSFL